MKYIWYSPQKSKYPLYISLSIMCSTCHLSVIKNSKSQKENSMAVKFWARKQEVDRRAKGMNEQLATLHPFYIVNSISVNSRQWKGNTERLFAMEPCNSPLTRFGLNILISVLYNMYTYYNMQISGLERKHITYFVLLLLLIRFN